MRGGSGPAGSRVDVHAEPLGREIVQERVVRPGRKPLIEIDQRADVARHRLRQAARDQLPVTLHEDESRPRSAAAPSAE